MGSVGEQPWMCSHRSHPLTGGTTVLLAPLSLRQLSKCWLGQLSVYLGVLFVNICVSCRALLDHRGMVCTPHLGASTAEAQLKVAQEIAQQFVDAVQGKGLTGVVRSEVFSNL